MEYNDFFCFPVGTALAHYIAAAINAKGVAVSRRWIVICGLALLAMSCGTSVTVTRDNVTTSGVVATSSGLGSASESAKGVSKSFSAASVSKAISGSFVAAPGFNVTVTNAITGATVCTTTTDSEGNYSCDTPPALVNSGLGDGIAHLYVASSPSNGRYTIINYVKQSVGSERYSSLSSGQADPDTTVATQSLENYAKTFDSSYAIGSPFPATMASRIAAGTLDEKTYVSTQYDYLANASLTGDGAGAAFAATRSSYRCLIGLGADPASLGLGSLSEFPKKVLDGTISSEQLSAIGSFTATQCGLDSSVTTKLTTASQVLPVVQTITAQHVAGDSSFRSELSNSTEAKAAWRSVIYAASSADNLTAVFSGTSNPIASLISNAKSESNFDIFSGDKPKAIVGYLGQAGGTVDLRDSTALTTVVNTIKAVDTTSMTATQVRDAGKSLQKLASVDTDFGSKVDIYTQYVVTNVKDGKLTTATIAATDFTAVKTNIDAVRTLHSGESATQIATAAAQYVDPTQLTKSSTTTTATQDPTSQYTSNTTYQTMCQSALSTYGYSSNYSQYCGSKPGAVTGVGASVGNGTNTVTWSTLSGATSYNLYWSTSTGVTTGTGTKISGVTSPYSHTSLTNGTTYYYIVTAVNSHGEGTASSEASARPLPPVPGTPASISTTPGNAQITLTWGTVSGATGYNIYYSTGASVSKSSTKISGATSPYTHTSLTNGTTYRYCIAVENIGGESDCSNAVTDVPVGTPSAGQSLVSVSPSSFVAGSGSTTITITAKDAFGSAISGASVTISVSGSNNVVSSPAATNSSGVTTATLSSITAGSKTVSATIGGVSVTQTATVTITAGNSDGGQSTISTSSALVRANGSSTSSITVTVKDSNGNLAAGKTVLIASTGSNNTIVQPASVTDANGQATGTIAATTFGSRTISATADGVAINATTTVTFMTPPQLLMHFDEASGATTFVDSSPNLTDKTCSGAGCPTAGVSGKFGTALSFNGSSNFISVGSSATFQPANFTVGAWINVTSGNNGAFYIYRWRADGLEFYMNAGRLGGYFTDTSGVGHGVLTTSTYNNATWVHVMCSYDGSAIRLYVNGSLYGSNPTNATVRYLAGGAAIGRDGNFSGLYYPGLLDDFVFYNVALSADEVTAIYNATSAIP